MAIRKWEYLTVLRNIWGGEILGSDEKVQWAGPQFAETLNALGEMGWELVATNGEPDNCLLMFKRPKG